MENSTNGETTEKLLAQMELTDERSGTGVIEFSMKEVSHPKYGSAIVKGSVTAILEEGVWQSHSKESEEAAFNYVSEWLDKNTQPFMVSSERDKLVRLGIDSTSHCYPPTWRLDSPLMIATITTVMAGDYADDILESGYFADGGISQTAFNMTDSLLQPLIDVLDGKYKSVEELPVSEIPMLQPVLWLVFFGYSEIVRHNDAAYLKDSKSKRLVSLPVRTIETSVIMSDKLFLNKCSEETYLALRQYEAATDALGVGLAIVYDFELSKNIRSNVIFKRFKKAAARILILVNDLFGMEKEMELDHPLNFVLRKVTQKKMTLQDAVGASIELLESETIDFIECSNKLVEAFPDDENVDRMIRAYKYEIEGQYRLYAKGTRWGAPVLNIVYDKK